MQAPTLGSAAMSKLRTADGIVPSFVTETEKTIFETAPIGVVRIDNGLRISYANAELHKICGATPGTLLGQEIWTMLPDERSRQIIHQQLRLRAAGESADYEVEIIRQDNSRRIVAKVAGVPLVGVDGDMIGTIGLVRDVTGLTGRDRILKDNDKCTDWGEVLAKLAARIGELIPYDEIAVTLYSRDRHLAQVIYWTDGKGETISQTQNWYTIEPVVQDWLKSLRPRLVHDLSSFYRRYRLTEWLTRKDSPVARGLKSSVYLPIAQEHALIASVALLSRQTRGFGRYDIRLLTSLPLKETVQLALYYRQVKEERFKFEILQRITASSSADELAQMLVTDLIQHYGWDNASLVRVDLRKRAFVLQAQAQGPKGYTILRTDNCPSLDQGIIGHSFKERRSILVNDVKHDPMLKDIYCEGSAQTNSELCIPVFIAQQIRWLVNFEDARLYAFSEENEEAIEQLLEEVGRTLQAMFERHALQAYLNHATRGVLVFDEIGCIEQVNRAFTEMIALPKSSLLGSHLTSLIPDAMIVDSLLTSATSTYDEIFDLRHANGSLFRAIVSTTRLPDVFGRCVMAVTPASSLTHLQNSEAIERALAEIGAQVRAPLAIAFGWAHQLKKKAGLGPIPQRLISQLNKLQITYDRLAQLISPNSISMRLTLNISDELSRSLDAMSDEDRERIDIMIAPDLPKISADPWSLSFAFQSMVLSLLRILPEDQPVKLSAAVSTGSGNASISTVASAKTPPRDPGSDRLKGELAAEIGLGKRILENIAHEHGGSFTVGENDDGLFVLELKLPVHEER